MQSGARNSKLRRAPDGRRFPSVLVVGALALAAACEVPLGETPVVTSLGACGDVTYQGYCDGKALVWCEDETLMREDCEADGRECALLPGDDGAFCSQRCGAEIGRRGRCDGSVRVWCEGGFELYQNCARVGDGAGAQCTWVPGDCAFACVGCGDIPLEGRCRGDDRDYCEDGRPYTQECWVQGKTCGRDPTSGLMACIPVSAPEACDPASADLHCTASGAQEWCAADGTVRRFSCGRQGLACGVEPSTGRATCTGCDVPWWDDTCVHGTRWLCVDDFVRWEACDATCDSPP